MTFSALFPVFTFLLVAFSVGGMLAAVFQPRLAARTELDGRLAVALGQSLESTKRAAGARKRSVEETLRELEEKQKAKAKTKGRTSLTVRMRQAGLGWSKTTYYAWCIACGAGTFLAMLALTGLGLLPAAGFGLAGGLLLPHLYVSRKRNGRFKKFSNEFPQAVDVVVRGVKAGLPLVDCLKIVAAESQEPVRSEFRTVVEDQTLGVPLDEAVERLADRVPVSEANFFGIVIAIQSRTGGSLSEALGNLSKVLRDRKKMKAKIQAMSSEAKASAGIIGALPPAVAFFVYLTSPDYIMLLFTTLVGNVVLVTSGLWMLIGILVMRKMINFDF